LGNPQEVVWREILGDHPQRWSEVLGYQRFEYEGSPDGDHGCRRIRRIVDLRPLALRQKPAGIPTTYRCALLATWDTGKANCGALEVARSYLKSPAGSLYIFGAVGTGKTWLVCTIANELLQRGRRVLFQAVAPLFLQLRATFGDEGGNELEVLEPLFAADYLVLDDLGDVALSRDCHASNFSASRILTLLDQRSQGGKPTIMTSNLSLDELVRWAGDERIGSRIRGVCGERGIVELTGRDLRFDREEPFAEHDETPGLAPAAVPGVRHGATGKQVTA
jgi:DNA replication protein DnaC